MPHQLYFFAIQEYHIVPTVYLCIDAIPMSIWVCSVFMLLFRWTFMGFTVYLISHLKIHFDSSPTIIVNKNIQKHYLVMCSLQKHIYIINGHTKLMRFYMSIDENLNSHQFHLIWNSVSLWSWAVASVLLAPVAKNSCVTLETPLSALAVQTDIDYLSVRNTNVSGSCIRASSNTILRADG